MKIYIENNRNYKKQQTYIGTTKGLSYLGRGIHSGSWICKLTEAKRNIRVFHKF